MNSTRNATLFHYSTTEIAFGAVIFVILMLGTFVGNPLTSLIFLRRPQLRTPTNISILFLSISDILMAGLVRDRGGGGAGRAIALPLFCLGYFFFTVFAPYRVRPFEFAPTLYRVRPYTFRVRPHQAVFAPK